MEQDLATQPSMPLKKKVNTWKVLTIVFVLLFIVAIFTKGFTLLNVTGKAVISQDDAKTKANDFIQKYLVSPGVEITINGIEEESGLYRIDVTAAGLGQSQDAKAYITKDGKLFFLQAIPLDDVSNLLNQSEEQPEVTFEEPEAPEEIVLGKDDDPSLGSDDASITIIEFSDFQCPFCARFAKEAFREIKTQYIDTGKVKFVYKDFPLTNIHRNSMGAALAANCANEQGKFWEYHDVLYDNQDNLDVRDLKRYAEDLGLDTSSFDECLDSKKYEEEISKDTEEGKGLKVTGTPTFIINGRTVKGALPFDSFKEIIDEELSR